VNSFVSPITTTTTTTTTKKVLVKYFGALGKICTSALLKVWKQFVHFTRVLFLKNNYKISTTVNHHHKNRGPNMAHSLLRPINKAA